MAIAATTALTGTVVGGPAVNAATTLKLKNNKLVYAKTGKVVKGYKIYKKKLYIIQVFMIGTSFLIVMTLKCMKMGSLYIG